MARIIQIGKRRWLAGMTWSSFEDAPSQDELEEDAQRLEASWVCVRIGESAVQAGFCAPLDNAKAPVKLFSLAAMLADSREQPWLGIFKIEEGLWWYVAVRDGHAILPDGDVIGGEAEIHAARDRHSGYADWKYIEGDISRLEEFIGEVDAKPTRVRPLTGGTSPLVLPVVVGAVILSLAAGGWWWWDQVKKHEEQERQVAMAKIRAQLAAGTAATLAASPLLTTPEPNEWLRACAGVIRPLPLSSNGWALSSVSCSTGAVSVHWVRGAGATVANKPEGVLAADGESVDQSIALTGLQVAGKNDGTDLPSAKLALLAWAQAAAFNLYWMGAAPIPTLPGATPDANRNKSGGPPRPPQAEFQIDVQISPFSVDFSSLHGLRLTSLKSTNSGWHLEGTLYAR